MNKGKFVDHVIALAGVAIGMGVTLSIIGPDLDFNPKDNAVSVRTDVPAEGVFPTTTSSNEVVEAPAPAPVVENKPAAQSNTTKSGNSYRKAAHTTTTLNESPENGWGCGPQVSTKEECDYLREDYERRGMDQYGEVGRYDLDE